MTPISGGDLDKLYRLVRTGPSDVKEHIPTFVNAVKELSASAVIELGVRYGVSTVAWIWALKECGHLWAVDGGPIPEEEPTMKVNLLQPLWDLSWWTFVPGWDTDQEVLDVLPDKADIVFIDTNHVYEETHRELELYFPRVRPGGRIFLHDTALEATANAQTPQPPYPVRTAMEEFCETHHLEYTNVNNCYGLGTIHV